MIKLIGMAILGFGFIMLIITFLDGNRKGIRQKKAELSCISESGYSNVHTISENKKTIYDDKPTNIVPKRKRAVSKEAMDLLEKVEAEKAKERDSAVEILGNAATSEKTAMLSQESGVTEPLQSASNESTEILKEESSESTAILDANTSESTAILDEPLEENEGTSLLEDVGTAILVSEAVDTVSSMDEEEEYDEDIQETQVSNLAVEEDNESDEEPSPESVTYDEEVFDLGEYASTEKAKTESSEEDEEQEEEYEDDDYFYEESIELSFEELSDVMDDDDEVAAEIEQEQEDDEDEDNEITDEIVELEDFL